MVIVPQMPLYPLPIACAFSPLIAVTWMTSFVMVMSPHLAPSPYVPPLPMPAPFLPPVAVTSPPVIVMFAQLLSAPQRSPRRTRRLSR